MCIKSATPAHVLFGIDTVALPEPIRASVSNPPASGGWKEATVKYVLLAVASDAEAERLIQDLTENPDEPLRTPRWGNAVYAALTSTQNPRLTADEIISTHEPVA